jgi:hypothetical protein
MKIIGAEKRSCLRFVRGGMRLTWCGGAGPRQAGGAGKPRAEERLYCEFCESFGHASSDCDRQDEVRPPYTERERETDTDTKADACVCTNDCAWANWVSGWVMRAGRRTDILRSGGLGPFCLHCTHSLFHGRARIHSIATLGSPRAARAAWAGCGCGRVRPARAPPRTRAAAAVAPGPPASSAVSSAVV